MAVPTAPTASTIVTEALNKAGESSPSSALTTRATDYWLEEIKNDIAQRKDWKLFESTKVMIPTAFQQRYADPTDFHKMLEVTFYDGGTKGTAQTGTSSSVTLASDETITAGTAEGRPIFITSGTAKNEMRRITDYNEPTKVATVSPNWATNPVANDTYMIADTEKDLLYIPNEPLRITAPTGYPSRCSYYNNEFYLDPIPDESTYAIVMRFLVTVSQVDLTSSLYTALLTEWRTALVNGVYMKKVQDDDDNRYNMAYQDYEASVLKLMIQDGRSKRQRNNSYAKSLGGLPRC